MLRGRNYGEEEEPQYTCQLSRLRRESHPGELKTSISCRLTHAWLKNVSCCHLAWHNFQKYVNSDPCMERKPCVKRINDNTFLMISDFWSEKHWEQDWDWEFGRLLQKTLGIFGNDCVVFKNPSTSRIKTSRLYLRKSWQVYHRKLSLCHTISYLFTPTCPVLFLLKSLFFTFCP